MDAISVYSVGTLGWLAAQALPLICWPSFVASLLTPDYYYQEITPVALYFARALGLAQLALGLVFIVLSGLLPLGPVAAARLDGSASSATTDAYASGAVLVSTLYHGAAAFYSYGCYYAPAALPGVPGAPGGVAGGPAASVARNASGTAFALGCAGSSVLAAMGVWTLLFGGGRSGNTSHISRRTGADKRTSAFPFPNASAASTKKQSKKE